MKNLCVTDEVVKYIIIFLLRDENKEFANNVIYDELPEQPIERTLYIKPSPFFRKGVYLTDDSKPHEVLESIDDTKILFGSNKIIYGENFILLSADLIASTFFLITRYEECICRTVRDEHGRFIGKKSIPYMHGFLDTPIVEDYGRILRKLLRRLSLPVKEPSIGFKHIYMTHDIDVPWSVPNSYLGYGKQILRDLVYIGIKSNKRWYVRDILSTFGLIKDPVDTFDWIIKHENSLKKIYGNNFDSVYFLMTCIKGKHDNGYVINRNKLQSLLNRLKISGSKFGLHISYRGGENPRYISCEQSKYIEIMNERACMSRNHYLMSREPEDMEFLIKAGIKEDFSMCYADGAGYRLGTCRAVQWINPVSMKVRPIVLHPLLATEGKLYPKEYMGMNDKQIIDFFSKQFRKIYSENGEVIILFHNTSFDDYCEYPYKFIYKKILSLLKEDYGYEDNSYM